MGEFTTPKGDVVAVDDEDLQRFSRQYWRVNAEGYVCRAGWDPVTKKRPHVALHREIMGLKPGDGLTVDHIDGDKLNNRRSNLRVCTIGENKCNQVGRRNGRQFKGVTFIKRLGKWQAQIQRDRTPRYLGIFSSPEEAHRAYCDAAKELHGEFANFGATP